MPGGCYIEGGDHLSDAFMWKTALGPMEERPGHMNANWGYWSTDGAPHLSIGIEFFAIFQPQRG